MRIVTQPGADAEHLHHLLADYVAFLETKTDRGQLSLESRLAELTQLPGDIVPPAAAYLLAMVDSTAAGCIAFGPIILASGEQHVAELRRMWVDPRFRGRAIGLHLATEAIALARAAGYTALVLDCLAPEMPSAMRLYHAVGFTPTERYKWDHSV